VTGPYFEQISGVLECIFHRVAAQMSEGLLMQASKQPAILQITCRVQNATNSK
jgi:hypothetical protein